jgi:hypothetical protein
LIRSSRRRTTCAARILESLSQPVRHPPKTRSGEQRPASVSA